MIERNVTKNELYRSVEIDRPPDVDYLLKQADNGWKVISIVPVFYPGFIGQATYIVYFEAA